MKTQKLKYIYHLGIRLTEIDEDMLNRLASNCGMTKSLYARRILRNAMNKEIRKESKE